MEKRMLTVTTSPHIKNEENTRSIMLDVIIALAFPLLLAGYFFGYRAYILTAVSVISCVLGEFLSRLIMKKNTDTIFDLSAVVTGILLAFNLPVTAPWWIAAVGGLFATIIVKQMFGGLGQNFMNPALAARVFLFSWTPIMTNWARPVFDLTKALTMPDAVTSATPLVAVKAGNLPDSTIFELLLGSRGGSLGETCALLLIAGGLYLLVRKVITWHIPVTFIGTVALFAYLFPRVEGNLMSVGIEVLSGGLILGAIYMATDYATTPVTSKGKIIFGIGCGLLTVLIRYFGGYPEGVSFSIIIMNLLTWFIDKWTKPKRFGGGAKLGRAK